MEQSQDEQILVEYQSRSTGKTQVRGAVTKKYYGYRKKGDQFMAYKSDSRARPDLLRPVHERDKPAPRVGLRGKRSVQQYQGRTVPPAQPAQPTRLPPQRVPDPPTQWRDGKDERGVRPASEEIRVIDWGRSLNKNHIRLLFQNNVRTLADVRDKGYDGLIKITGIGDKIAKTLLEKAEEEAGLE